jgi:TonB family protein
MKRILACVLGLGLTTAAHGAAVVRVRVTSLNDLLRDAETLSTSAHKPFDRAQLLQQVAMGLGVADLSFLDFTRPLVIAMPDEGRSLPAGKGFVLAVPVKDGAAALDAVAHWFGERSVEDGLTVLRPAAAAGAGGALGSTMYAVVRGRALIVGATAECVRALDPLAAASGDDLPPGSLALSLEVESLRDELQAGLAAAREAMKQMPRPSPPAREPGAAPDEETSGEPVAPIDVTEGVTPPQLLEKITPSYPENARLSGLDGRVVLRAVIDTEGNVRNVSVLRSDDPVFDQAAIDAVERWKYAPALQDGRPVAVNFTVVVQFKLDGGKEKSQQIPVREQPPSFDPHVLEPLFDFYFAFLRDTIDSVSKLQTSIEVEDGFLIVHGRGTERPGSTLAGFIAAQQDTGLPAIGRMMPAQAPILVAGRLDWTEPSRAWLKGFMESYRGAMSGFLRSVAQAEPDRADALVRQMELWSSDEIVRCQRGDFAYAVDGAGSDMQMLQVAGVSSVEGCRGVLASLVAKAQSSTGAAIVEKEVLEPENVPTWVYRVRLPTALSGGAATTSPEMTVRFAEVGDMIISGTDEWATKAIREAAQAREGSVPGRGGLLLTDLGPFSPRPGVFGRMQLGALMRRQLEAQAPGSESLSAKLIEALEGPAGAIPFGMHFDDGAATLELAFPLAMLEAFAEHAPEPTKEPEGDEDEEQDE